MRSSVYLEQDIRSSLADFSGNLNTDGNMANIL